MAYRSQDNPQVPDNIYEDMLRCTTVPCPQPAVSTASNPLANSAIFSDLRHGHCRLVKRNCTLSFRKWMSQNIRMDWIETYFFYLCVGAITCGLRASMYDNGDHTSFMYDTVYVLNRLPGPGIFLCVGYVWYVSFSKNYSTRKIIKG